MIILLILGHLMGNFNFPLDQQVSILFHCLSKSKLLFGFFVGFSLGVQIHQSPSVIKKADANVEILCKHEKSDYRVMLWYQKRRGETALKLVGYGYAKFNNDSVEEPFRKHFKLSGDLEGEKKHSLLTIINLKPLEHTATYFCAAREAHCIKHPSSLNKNLFFAHP